MGTTLEAGAAASEVVALGYQIVDRDADRPCAGAPGIDRVLGLTRRDGLQQLELRAARMRESEHGSATAEVVVGLGFHGRSEPQVPVERRERRLEVLDEPAPSQHSN